jgi:hypothetical protein
MAGMYAAALKRVATEAKPPKPPPPALMVDMDGTLSSCEWRRYLVDRPPRERDWGAFFEQQTADAVVPEVMAEIVAAKDRDWRVVLMTARPSNYRYQTEWWLMLNRVPYDRLVMREEGDYRPDPVVKRELFEKQVRKYFQVELAIDDRSEVLAVWRELGLPVIVATDPGLPPVDLDPPVYRQEEIVQPT